MPDPKEPIQLPPGLTLGGGGAPANSVSAPSSQEWIMMPATPAMTPQEGAPAAPAGFIFVKNPNFRPAAAPAGNTVTRADGSVYRIGADDKPIKILDPGGKPLGVTTVATNTTDQYIVTVDQTTGEMVPVFNPNYKPAQPGAVSTNTSDQFIVTRSADGTLNTAPNPNYVAPKPGTIATDSSSKFIVQQAADGSVKTIANPNYVEKTPTTLAGTTGTDSPFIMQQQPDGSLKQVPNPNYVPKTPTVVGTDTTSPFIVRSKPDGSIEQIPNPNYQAKPTVVTTDTTSPFIVRQGVGGAIEQVPNPNYQAPKPTVVSTGADQAFITTMGPDGKLTSQANPSYTPKTIAEVQARVGQIQSIMQSKQTELQGKVGQTVAGKLYTADDALKDFNAWHAQNVQPQMGALQAAQQAAAFQQAKDEAAMRTNAYNAASNAGTQAINAAKEDKSGRVGPGFGDFMNKITAGKGLATGADFGNAFTFQAPLAADQAHNAVMEALKHISPTAAAATGSPMPQYGNVDIAGQLGAMPYWPQGQQGGGAPPAPAPAAVAAPAAPAPVPAPAPTEDPLAWYQALRGRQAVDVAAQQRQAQVAGSPDQWAQWIPDYSLA